MENEVKMADGMWHRSFRRRRRRRREIFHIISSFTFVIPYPYSTHRHESTALERSSLGGRMLRELTMSVLS